MLACQGLSGLSGHGGIDGGPAIWCMLACRGLSGLSGHGGIDGGPAILDEQVPYLWPVFPVFEGVSITQYLKEQASRSI